MSLSRRPRRSPRDCHSLPGRSSQSPQRSPREMPFLTTCPRHPPLRNTPARRTLGCNLAVRGVVSEEPPRVSQGPIARFPAKRSRGLPCGNCPTAVSGGSSPRHCLGCRGGAAGGRGRSSRANARRTAQGGAAPPRRDPRIGAPRPQLSWLSGTDYPPRLDGAK